MENIIKQNESNTSLLIDCYSILYRIQFVMKIIGETEEGIQEYKQKVENIESKLLDSSNKPDSNYNQLLLELKTIEEVLNCIYQKRLK